MKKTRKRITAILLSLCMLLVMIPTTVIAASSDELWVNGVDIIAAENHTVTCGSGTAVYDSANRILTLTNAKITEPKSGVTSQAVEEYGIFSRAAALNGKTLTINLIGANSIELVHSGKSSNGISLNSTDLTISGAGSLNISLCSTATSAPYGVSANTIKISCSKLTADVTPDNENLSVKGSALYGKNGISLKNVSVTCKNFQTGIDERSANGITIDNAVVDIANTDEAVISNSSIDIVNGSDIKAFGNLVGMSAENSISISGSKVTAETTEDECNAILTWGDMAIASGSNVTATSYYPALYAECNMTIESSTVNATSSYDTGVWAYGSMVITSADITANGITSIGASGSVEISKSKLNLAGEQTGIRTEDSLSIAECSDMSVKAGYSPIVADGTVTIDECTGNIESVGCLDPDDPESGRIYNTAIWSGDLIISGNSTNLSITGSDGIICDGNMTFHNGKISVEATNGGGIDVEGIFDFRGGELHAKGTTNAVCTRVFSDQADLTTPPSENPNNFLIAENYGEAGGAKIASTGWLLGSVHDGELDETVKKWVYKSSLISANDESGILLENSSNAVKEVTLKIKSAIYDEVNAAVTKARALNKDEYKDFSAVKAAVDAVVYGKNITEQDVVNGYAAAIEDAIAALEYKDADYDEVDAAVAKAKALSKDEYKDFSHVEAAVNAVVYGKNITEQGDVDAMAKAINDALSALVKKPDSKPSNPDSPQTGDTSNIALWFVLMAAAGIGLTGTAVYGRKKRLQK